MLPDVFDENGNPAYLFVVSADADPLAVPLEGNNSLFVGSGSNCRVALSGGTVEPIHCMFWLNDEGVLRVQDWNTSTGTILNGDVVADETILNSGDELNIGGHRVVPVLSKEVHQHFAGHFPATVQPDNEIIAESEAQQDSGQVLELELENPEAEIPVQPEFQSESSDTSCKDQESAEAKDSGFHYDALAELDEFGALDVDHDMGMGADCGFASSLTASASKDEELELLRLEVDQLRFELAEKDSNLKSIDEVGHQSEPMVSEDQTAQLVIRLEELLEELQNSDARVRGLEDLLRVSDQATQAERDERKQLESWVGEIEQRVSQREAESEAELTRLQVLLDESNSRRKHTQLQLKQVLQSKDGNQAQSDNSLVLKLREQIEELEQDLDKSKSQNELLQKNASSTEEDPGRHERISQLEQKLLQQEVETSRERAEMSRQRAELEMLKGELDEKMSSATSSGNGDARLKAMREHLREIHAEEANEKAQRKQRSLGGRIARLLNKSGH